MAVDGLTGLASCRKQTPTAMFKNLLVLCSNVRGLRRTIADRNFGNLVQAEQFTDSGDHRARLHSGCTIADLGLAQPLTQIKQVG